MRFDKTFWLKRKEKNYAKDKKDGDCVGFDDDDELREEREATSRHDITQPAHDSVSQYIGLLCYFIL